ncbi:MAG: replication-relaxation family protein [Candidatus Levyibacteriota bacterium]|nr:MAG: replication-relaxation family protein [Candidatus Levybacteria bacterium]
MEKLKKTTQPLSNHQERLNPFLEQILIFIYKFRYLSRPQIQKLMNHKHHHTIMLWLNYLVSNKYLRKYIDSKYKIESAYFSLGTMARKYFLKTAEIQDINYPKLDRVWKENSYSESFKKHCMFLAHIYLSLLDLVKSVDEGKGKLHYFSNADLEGVEHMIYPLPDAYFTIEDKDGAIERYFLDVFYDYTRWGDMEKRVKQYLNYCNKQTWQLYMKHDFPKVILVCPKPISKNNLEEYIQKMYKEKGKRVAFYLSTKEEIRYQGMNSRTLHEVK